jgi:hypothetical protein
MVLKRTCLLSTLLAALLLLGAPSPVQAQFGVAAGLNFESTGDISTNTDATLDNSAGYHVGVLYDLSVGPLSLRPGVFYRKVGQTYELPNSTADVAAWEVPVDLRLNVLPIPVVSPYILAGPKASFLRSDAGELDDDLKDISYSIAIGVGAEISLGSLMTLQPELRYDIGTTDYIDDEITVGGTTFSQEDPTLSAFALRLNLLF